MPASDTLVEGHEGPIETLLEERTVVRSGTEAVVPKPRRLELAEVGLTAPDPDCPTQ
jgi:hypothetical protein